MKLHPPVLNRKHRATRTGLLCTALLAATAFTAHAQNTGFGTVTPASKVTVKGNFAVGTGAYTTIAAPAFGAIVQGFTGIGIVAPTNQLHVFAAADPVRFEGLQFTTDPTAVPLVVLPDGVVKKAAPVLSREFIQIKAAKLNTYQYSYIDSERFAPSGSGRKMPFGDELNLKSSNADSLFSYTTDSITLEPSRTYKLTFNPNLVAGTTLSNPTTEPLMTYQFHDGTNYIGSAGSLQTSTYSNTQGTLTTYIRPTTRTTVSIKVRFMTFGTPPIQVGHGSPDPEFDLGSVLTAETVD